MKSYFLVFITALSFSNFAKADLYHELKCFFYKERELLIDQNWYQESNYELLTSDQTSISGGSGEINGSAEDMYFTAQFLAPKTLSAKITHRPDQPQGSVTNVVLGKEINLKYKLQNSETVKEIYNLFCVIE